MTKRASIYVSSKYDDLRRERMVIIDAIGVLEAACVAMEHQGASSRPPLARCLADVRRADIYVGIIAWSVGSSPPEQPEISYTEAEFREASTAGKQRLIYLQADELRPAGLSDDDPIWRLRAHVKAAGITCRTFATDSQLALHVANDLKEEIARLDEVTAPSIEEWRSFATWIATRLLALNSDAGWSDGAFADMPAEVEIPGKSKSWSSHLGLARRPSLHDALRGSDEQLVLLEGDAGSGKSVALRHLALTLARAAAQATTERLPLPIYANFRDCDVGPAAIGVPHAVQDLVLRLVANQSEANLDAWERYFAWGRRKRAFVLLLDSFDEIPEVLRAASDTVDGTINAYTAALKAFATTAQGSRVVVASRPYRALEHLGATRYRLLPLGEEARRNFVRAFFRDNARREANEPGAPTSAVSESAWQAKAQQALAELVRTQARSDWIDNPLVLGLFCEHCAAHDGALPESLRAAFDSFVQRRIAADSKRARAAGLDSEQARRAVEQLAAAMTLDPDPHLVADANRVSRLLAALHTPTSAAPEVVVDYAIAIGLGRGSQTAQASLRKFSFFHRRLQEFLASCAVLNGYLQLDDGVLVSDERWRETAVVLLDVSSKAQRAGIMNAAANWLERGVDSFRARLPGLDSRLLTDPERMAATRAELALTEVSWPPGMLHVLGLLGAASASNRDGVESSRVYAAADLILGVTMSTGFRHDQAAALEVCGAASYAARCALLTFAFWDNSPWLHDLAFRQAARLEVIPEEVRAGIRRMLVWREIAGDLRREPTRARVEIQRIADPESLLAFLPALETCRRADAACIALVGLFSTLLAWLWVDGKTVPFVGCVVVIVGAAWVGYFIAHQAVRVALRGTTETRSHKDGMEATFQRVRARLPRWLRLARGDLQAECAKLYLVPVLLRLGMVWGALETIHARDTAQAVVVAASFPLLVYRPGVYCAIHQGTLRKGWPWVSGSMALLRVAVRMAPAAALGGALFCVPLIVLSTTLFYAGLPFQQRLVAIGSKWQPWMAIPFLLYIGALFVAQVVRNARQVRNERREMAALRAQRTLFGANDFLVFLLSVNGERRLAGLRWIREQVLLAPTEDASHVLRDLLQAIERDRRSARLEARRRMFTRSKGVVHGPVERSWCKTFAKWYDEDCLRHRIDLSDWAEPIVDELARLRVQVRSRAEQPRPSE